MMLKGFELLYAYLDQNTIRWTEPDESVYNAISCVEKELRRQKRKRCLAMAEWCDAEADVADADGDYEDMRWYQKWHERWLEIADKFKEET